MIVEQLSCCLPRWAQHIRDKLRNESGAPWTEPDDRQGEQGAQGDGDGEESFGKAHARSFLIQSMDSGRVWAIVQQA